MKVWRCGFMRCSTREEPWGSHHVEARALKCDISEALTEGETGCCGGGVEEAALDVFVLWHRLATKRVLTHTPHMLRRNWRTVAAVRRGIKAFMLSLVRGDLRKVVRECSVRPPLLHMSGCRASVHGPG